MIFPENSDPSDRQVGGSWERIAQADEARNRWLNEQIRKDGGKRADPDDSGPPPVLPHVPATPQKYPVAPLPLGLRVIPPEVVPVSKEDRVCPTPGCSRKLRSDNTKGKCSKCQTGGKAHLKGARPAPPAPEPEEIEEVEETLEEETTPAVDDAIHAKFAHVVEFLGPRRRRGARDAQAQLARRDPLEGPGRGMKERLAGWEFVVRFDGEEWHARGELRKGTVRVIRPRHDADHGADGRGSQGAEGGQAMTLRDDVRAGRAKHRQCGEVLKVTRDSDYYGAPVVLEAQCPKCHAVWGRFWLDRFSDGELEERFESTRRAEDWRTFALVWSTDPVTKRRHTVLKLVAELLPNDERVST
jgi:hypothetical protein